MQNQEILGDEGPIICITRYGNVMASRGSVIPLFINQIKESKPLTVTDPEMTRFMMSLDEAVDLVLYAFKMEIKGIFLFKNRPHQQWGFGESDDKISLNRIMRFELLDKAW